MGEAEVDPAVVEAVAAVRDRFGLAGLRSLVAEATAQARAVEEALDELGRYAEESASTGTSGTASTPGTPSSGSAPASA